MPRAEIAFLESASRYLRAPAAEQCENWFTTPREAPVTNRLLRTSPPGRSPKAVWLVACILSMFAALLLAPNTRAQEIGYSYMRLEIGGHLVTNFVDDKKYQGWMQVLSVDAMLAAAVKKADNAKFPTDTSKSSKNAELPWTTLPKILISGRAGAGEIRFAAG